jgi:hypothetical protein
MYDPFQLLMLYKYGTLTPSANPNDRIRPQDFSQETVSYDGDAYMDNGGGRYVLPSEFPVVQDFFNYNNFLPDGDWSIAQVENFFQYTGNPNHLLLE